MSFFEEYMSIKNGEKRKKERDFFAEYNGLRNEYIAKQEALKPTAEEIAESKANRAEGILSRLEMTAERDAERDSAMYVRDNIGKDSFSIEEAFRLKGEGKRKIAEAKAEASRLRADANQARDEAIVRNDMMSLSKWENDDIELMDFLVDKDNDNVNLMNIRDKQLQEKIAARDKLFAKYGTESVKEIASSLKRIKNAEATRKVAEKGQKNTSFWDNLLSVPVSIGGGLLSAMETLRQSASNATGMSDTRFATADANLPGNRANAYVQNLRGQTAANVGQFAGNAAEKIGFGENVQKGASKAAQTVYGAGMSALESLTRIVIGGGGTGSLALAGTGAFGSASQEAREAGATDGQAIAMGLASAGIEILTEKISLDNLLDHFGKGKVSKGFLKNVLKQGGFEASEEEMSFLGNLAAEAAILGENSGVNRRIHAYMDDGLTEEEAKKKVTQELFAEAGQTAIESFLSGGMMASVTGGFNKLTSPKGPTEDVKAPNVETETDEGDKVSSQFFAEEGETESAQKPTVDPVEELVEEVSKPTETKKAAPVAVEDVVDEVQREKTVDSISEAFSVLRKGEAVTNKMAEKVLANPEAVKVLTEKTGMELPESKSGKRQAVKDAIDALYKSIAEDEGLRNDTLVVDASEYADDTADDVAENRSDYTEEAELPGVADPAKPERAVGSAQFDFDNRQAYWDLLYDGNVKPARADDAKYVEIPERDANGKRVTDFASNAANAAVTSDRDSDMIIDKIMSGEASFDTITNKEQAEKAAAEIKDKGESAVRSQITKAVEKGKITDSDIAKAQVLFAINSNKKGKRAQEAAAELFVDLSQMANQAGRNLQLFKLLRKLTPEGQYMVVQKTLQRTVDGINKGRSKKNQIGDIEVPQNLKDDFMEAVEGTLSEEGAVEKAVEKSAATDEERKESAKKAVDKAVEDATKDSKDAEDSDEEPLEEIIGKRIANAMSRKAGKVETPIEEILFQEIYAYAKQKSKVLEDIIPKLNKKNLSALENFITYSPLFQEATRIAKEKVQAKVEEIQAENPYDPRLTKMKKFLSSEEIGKGMHDINDPKSTIREAAKDAAKFAGYKMENYTKSEKTQTKLKDVLLENAESRANAVAEIQRVAVAEMELSEEDAAKMANDIADAFYKDLEERAARKLSQMFGEKGKTEQVQKSVAQLLNELYNIGGTRSEQYTGIAFDSKDGESYIRKLTKKAAQDIGYKMANASTKEKVQSHLEDVLLKSKADKDAVANEIAQSVSKDLDVDAGTAKFIADKIVESFNADLAERSAKKLSQMFADKETAEKVEKSFRQKLEELYNLGAFDNPDYRQKAFDKLFGEEGIDISDELLTGFMEAAEKDKHEALVKIQKCAAEQIPATLLDKFTAMRYLNMLGNLRTQVTNFAGNSAMAVTGKIKDTLATAIEIVSDKASGGKVGRTKTFTVSKGMMDSAKAYFDTMSEYILGGGKFTDNQQTSSDIARGIYENRKIFNFKPLEFARKLVGDVMDKGDIIFAKPQFARALAGYLKANGVTDTDFSKVDEALMEKALSYAIKEAQENTFRDHNTLSDWVSKIGRRPDTPRAARMLSEGMQPFRRTPANVFMRIYEYSPASLVQTLYDTFKKSDMPPTEIINEWAKTITGSGMLAIGMILANAGIIRVRDDDDKEEEFDRSMGYGDFAIVLPNGVNFPIGFLTPAAVPMLMGAQLKNAMDEEGLSLKSIGSALTSMAEPVVQMSMLKGVEDTMSKLKGSDNNLMQLGLNLMTSYLTQGLTNTLLGQLERSFEHKRMTTYIDRESGMPAWLQKEIGKASAKTPGIDYSQIPYINPWGEEESDNVLWAVFENMLLPTYVNQGDTSELVEELNRLHDVQGENVYPRRPEETFTYTEKNGKVHQNESLPADKWVEYAKEKGQTQKRILDSMLNSNMYKMLSDSGKASAVNMAYKYAGEYAKGKFLSGYQTFASMSWAKNAHGSEAKVILQRAVADELVENMYGDNAKQYQKVSAIAKANGKLSNAQQDAIISEVLGDTVKYKFDEVKKLGYSNDDFADTYKIFETASGSKKKEEVIKKYRKEYHMSTKAAEKLYSIYSKPTQHRKVSDIAGGSGSESEKAEAIKKSVSTSLAEKFDKMQDKGYSVDDFADSYELYSTASGSGQEKRDKVVIGFMRKLKIKRKAAEDLYDLYTGRKK